MAHQVPQCVSYQLGGLSNEFASLGELFTMRLSEHHEVNIYRLVKSTFIGMGSKYFNLTTHRSSTVMTIIANAILTVSRQ